MASIINLHLQYRLWIADLNADITVLRIFDDYLEDVSGINNENIKNEIFNYKKQFVELRKEMDDLRHEMHLNKMKLAAVAKTPETSVNKIEEEINHEIIKNRYKTFRKKFDDFKKNVPVI